MSNDEEMTGKQAVQALVSLAAVVVMVIAVCFLLGGWC